MSDFIGKALGGAGATQHFIVLDHEPDGLKRELLLKANWTIVKYAQGQHDNVKVLLRNVIGECARSNGPSNILTPVSSQSFRSLAVAYINSLRPNRTAFETAGGAIVSRVLQTGPLRLEDLHQKAASLMAISEDDAGHWLQLASACC